MTLDIDFVRVNVPRIEYHFSDDNIVDVFGPVWYAQDYNTGREYYITADDELVVIPPGWFLKVSVRQNPRTEDEVRQDPNPGWIVVGSARKDLER